MVKILRVVSAVVGMVLVFGSSVLTWVHVDIDTEALGELAGELAEENIEVDDETAELIDDAGEIASRARDLIPDRLLEATLDGQNAYDLFGFGFLLISLAGAAAVCGVIWALTGTRWLRWIGLFAAVFLLASAILAPVAIFATDTALDAFLPEDWKQFSPSFELTTAPLGTIGGSVVLFLGLLGRSPRQPTGTPTSGAPPAAPPPPTNFTTVT